PLFMTWQSHESWSDTVLIGGTVFNQLVIWKPGAEVRNQSNAQVERRLLGHSGVIFGISYLQNEGVLASASDDRSVRQCGDDNPVFFSVKLLNGKVCSAGEDGACLVWENGKVVQTLKGHRAGGVRALAISSKSCDKAIWVATGGADGGVRLWKLGVQSDEVEGDKEKLVDLKFPKDKMDNTEMMKRKVKPKDQSLKPESVKNQHKANFSQLEGATQVDYSESMENLANKGAVTIGNLETEEQSNDEMLRTHVYQNVDDGNKSQDENLHWRSSENNGLVKAWSGWRRF
uniref:tRNA (34-2'-O)-methyltransferase regulator WDR6 n=1 Tax=Neogobius melanostomus TaxID=47308 RepID=A0A8C6SBQ7_9GOBI